METERHDEAQLNLSEQKVWGGPTISFADILCMIMSELKFGMIATVCNFSAEFFKF